MISGDEAQTLQFVLQPGKKLTIDMDSLCWVNETITLKSRGLFIDRLLSVNLMLGDAANDSRVPSIIALNQIEKGKILVLNVDRIALYCFKNSFIASTENVSVISKQLPFTISLTNITISHLFNKAHFCSSITGRNNNDGNRIFLQSGSIILTKELKANESLIIKFQCIVAFEESCKISVANVYNNMMFIFGGNDTFLKIVGPGNVYFCAHTSTRTFSNTMRSRIDINNSLHANMSIVGICVYISFVGLLFYSVSLILSKFVAVEINNLEGPANLFRMP